MGMLSNAKWVGLSQIFKIFVQLINIVVLARLIPPSEYGLMAMATVVVNLALLVRDLGTSAAIIQRKNLTPRTINAVFWLNIFMGVGIALFIVITSPFVSTLFHQDKLVIILCLLSLSFPLASSSSAHLALMERESQFKKVAFIEISSSLVSVAIAILLAFYGFGVMSLVWQILIMNAMSTCQLWISSNWRPNFRIIWDVKELKKIFGFSANLTVFNFINYFSRNADSMIIGHFFSAAILGSYSLAYRVMLFPLQSLTFVASRSLFPILSKEQDNSSSLKSIYLNAVYFILILVFPMMIGLATLRYPFVQLVFGPQWSLTADILLWLAPTGIIQSVLSTSGSVFMSKGKTKILMMLGFLGALLQVSAFIIGSFFDIIMFSKFYFIANVINFFPVMFILMRLLDDNIFSLMRIFVKPALATFFMVVVLKFLMSQSIFFTVDTYTNLLLLILVGILSYSLFILAVEPRLLSFIMRRMTSKS